MDNGQWTMDNGQWTVDNGQWTMDSGQWTVDNGQWAMECASFQFFFQLFGQCITAQVSGYDLAIGSEEDGARDGVNLV